MTPSRFYTTDPTDPDAPVVLDEWHGLRDQVRLVPAGSPYDRPAEVTVTDDGLELDPFYEAKALGHVAAGDTFWVVGIRNTLREVV